MIPFVAENQINLMASVKTDNDRNEHIWALTNIQREKKQQQTSSN